VRKRAWWLIVGLLLLVGVVLWFQSSDKTSQNANKKTVRIGVVLPFSGDMAPFGENGKEGLLLAKHSIESSSPNLEIELVFQDSQGNPTGTVAAVRRLIDAQGVQYIIGGLTSSGVLAAAPYAQERGVLFFSPAASAPGIPGIGDLVLRNWQSDSALADLFGRAAHERLGLDSVAIVHVSNDYGETNATTFRESFLAEGGSIPLVRAMSKGATEVKTLVTQLRGLDGLDGVLLAVYPDEYKALYQEMGPSGIGDAQLLATDTFYSPELLDTVGANAEGTVCAVAAKPADDYSPREKFIQDYKSHYKAEDGTPKSPGLVSDTAYDALRLVAGGILGTDGQPRQVAEWILQQRNYQGAAGPTTFTADGDIEGGISLYRVEGGDFVSVSK